MVAFRVDLLLVNNKLIIINKKIHYLLRMCSPCLVNNKLVILIIELGITVLWSTEIQSPLQSGPRPPRS